MPKFEIVGWKEESIELSFDVYINGAEYSIIATFGFDDDGKAFVHSVGWDDDEIEELGESLLDELCEMVARAGEEILNSRE